VLQTAITSQLTGAVAKERAADLSGVLATMTPLSAVFGIASFGSAYLALASPGGIDAATHAFAIVNAAFAASAAVAAVTAFVAMSGGKRVRALRAHAARLDLVEQLDRNRDAGVA
jgi:hypothetical protein